MPETGVEPVTSRSICEELRVYHTGYTVKVPENQSTWRFKTCYRYTTPAVLVPGPGFEPGPPFYQKEEIHIYAPGTSGPPGTRTPIYAVRAHSIYQSCSRPIFQL